MNADGSEPEGKKIITVWSEGDGLHIDSRTLTFHDPAEWGEVLADVALHLAHASHDAELMVQEDEGSSMVRVEVDAFLERLHEGFKDRLEDPPDYELQTSMQGDPPKTDS